MKSLNTFQQKLQLEASWPGPPCAPLLAGQRTQQSSCEFIVLLQVAERSENAKSKVVPNEANLLSRGHHCTLKYFDNVETIKTTVQEDLLWYFYFGF